MTPPGSGATFTNPVIPGFHPDPSICRVGEHFYLVVSSFEYFPGIPIFSSTDLVSWTPLGHVLDRTSQLDLTRAPASGGVYAPTIRYHDGLFFVTATNVSDRGHFIVHAADPRGPWSDPVWVAQNGIDPSLFFENGFAFFSSNVEPQPAGPHVETPDFARGIQQSLVDPLTGELLTEPRFIWEGTGGRYPEAPHLYRRGDFYYLVLAEGGTEYGHMATVGRSRSPWGPFEASPHGPLVSHRSLASPFQAVGHADLVTLPNGDWWLVCLGVRPVGQWPRHLLGRETLLAPVRWLEDGWPAVGERGEIALEQQRPPLPADPAPVAGPRDDFEDTKLRPEWEFVRRPLDAVVLHRTRPGWLTLIAEDADLSGRFPCFVGRRQQHYAFSAQTQMEYSPASNEEESGIAVRMNDSHFFALGLRRRDSVMEVVFRQTVGRLELCTVIGEAPVGNLVLRVRGTSDTYTFSAVLPDGAVLDADPADSRFLATEFAGGFTGVFLGPYAASSAGRSAPAYFDWFDYSPTPAIESGLPRRDAALQGAPIRDREQPELAS